MRTHDARPGSAWDTWHLAGFTYAENGGGRGDALTDAASMYSGERQFRREVVERAFRAGAQNFWDADATFRKEKIQMTTEIHYSEMLNKLASHISARFEKALERVDYRSAVSLILAIRAIQDDDMKALDDVLCHWEPEDE